MTKDDIRLYYKNKKHQSQFASTAHIIYSLVSYRVCCIQHKSGGFYKTVQYSKKQGKKIVNLEDVN